MISERNFRITQGRKNFPPGHVYKFATLGELVRLDDLRVGRIRYIGPLHLARGDFVGLQLLNADGIFFTQDNCQTPFLIVRDLENEKAQVKLGRVHKSRDGMEGAEIFQTYKERF